MGTEFVRVLAVMYDSQHIWTNPPRPSCKRLSLTLHDVLSLMAMCLHPAPCSELSAGTTCKNSAALLLHLMHMCPSCAQDSAGCEPDLFKPDYQEHPLWLRSEP